MKTIFKILPLILITSMVSFAQSKIISKVLPTNASTVLRMDFKEAQVQLLTSPDQNIYIDFEVEFQNYDVDEMEILLSGIQTDVRTSGDAYIFTIDSKKTMSKRVYNLESSFGITLDNFFDSGKTSNRKYKKTKAELLDMIDKKDDNSFLKTLQTFNADGTTEPIDLETVKSYGATIIVKVPESIELNFMLDKSSVNFKVPVKNMIRCQGENSTVRGKRFENPKSIFDLKNGRLEAYELIGGRFMLKDLNNILIGSVNDVTIESEFSRFTIGEVQANVKISDFNSEFWIHNFDPAIGQFSIDSEYSKINMYLPKDKKDFVITTYGYGTVHYVNGAKTEIRPSRSKESSTMMVIGNKDSITKNRINLNTINGIIKVGDDYIEK